jgi:hypothetical protein
MVIDNNGPEAPYPGPDEKAPDTGKGHGSGLEQAESEPKQGTGERPEDWNPPPGNPGPTRTPRRIVATVVRSRLRLALIIYRESAIWA